MKGALLVLSEYGLMNLLFRGKLLMFRYIDGDYAGRSLPFLTYVRRLSTCGADY